MKPIPSPLTIIDFAILQLEYAYVPSLKSGGEDITIYFDEYELDVDFDMSKNDITQVFMRASINRGDIKLPGYSINIEIACLFDFNKDVKLTPEQKNSIEGFSTVYIGLNALRGFISQLTSSGPVGRYMLPSIDLNDLINQKKLAITQVELSRHEKKENSIKKTKAKKMKRSDYT
jgi:hypothetical protein